MTPILSAETLEQIEKNERKKFVRDGGVIAFDQWQMRHAIIADFNKLGMRVAGKRPLEDMGAIDVDDAGSMFAIGEKLHVSGDSNTCNIRGDADKQRSRTVEILKSLTDKEIVPE